MLKKLEEALVVKVLMKGIVGVDVEDIGEAPHVKNTLKRLTCL